MKKLILISTFIFFTVSNIYAVELLVMARDKIHPNAEKNRVGSVKKGYIVEVREDGCPYGSGEGLYTFIIVKIPGVSLEQAERRLYVSPWLRYIDWEIVVFNASMDGYRIKVFATQISVTAQDVNYGKISLSDIQDYLAGWNGLVHSHSDNEIIFDLGTYEMVKSTSFWEKNTSGVIFSEEYNQLTGIHTITADFSAKDWPPEKVLEHIEDREGNVISYANKVITFEIQGTGNPEAHAGNIPLKHFKNETKEKVDKILYRRRFYIDRDTVDYVIGLGGIVSITKQQFLNYLIDRLEH